MVHAASVAFSSGHLRIGLRPQTDPDILGGKLAARGTRLSASLTLACLAEGMSVEEIEATYGTFPHEVLPEIMKATSEVMDTAGVVA